jgi:hypothetical protein
MREKWNFLIEINVNTLWIKREECVGSSCPADYYEATRRYFHAMEWQTTTFPLD